MEGYKEAWWCKKCLRAHTVEVDTEMAPVQVKAMVATDHKSFNSECQEVPESMKLSDVTSRNVPAWAYEIFKNV